MSDKGMIEAMGEVDVVQRLDSAEERIAALERNGFEKVEGETRKRDFIRAAAVAIWQEAEDPSQLAACWAVAKALWDAKPEDC